MPFIVMTALAFLLGVLIIIPSAAPTCRS